MKMIPEKELHRLSVTMGRMARFHFLKGHTSKEGEKETFEYLKAWFEQQGVKVEKP